MHSGDSSLTAATGRRRQRVAAAAGADRRSTREQQPAGKQSAAPTCCWLSGMTHKPTPGRGWLPLLSVQLLLIPSLLLLLLLLSHSSHKPLPPRWHTSLASRGTAAQISDYIQVLCCYARAAFAADDDPSTSPHPRPSWAGPSEVAVRSQAWYGNEVRCVVALLYCGVSVVLGTRRSFRTMILIRLHGSCDEWNACSVPATTQAPVVISRTERNPLYSMTDWLFRGQ